MADLQRAKRAAARTYLKRPPDSSLSNIVGVGVGSKIKRGQFTETQAVRIYVAVKVDAGSVPKELLIPPELEGVPTDVVEIGRLLPAGEVFPAPRTRIRPPQPGCSIGVMRELCLLSGTFGAVVQDEERRYLLTCNHVVADDDPAFLGRAVLQPGPSDGPGERIATVSRFLPIRPATTTDIDAALAELSIPDNPAVLAPIGRLATTIPGRAAERMPVEKIGRATGYTAGTVFDIAADFPIPYSFGAITLRDQILIYNPEHYFAFSGDSGSLIVDRDTKTAVGLLCGCSYSSERGFYGVANHLDRVVNALGITLVA
jgi:hypothetical protein